MPRRPRLDLPGVPMHIVQRGVKERAQAWRAWLLAPLGDETVEWNPRSFEPVREHRHSELQRADVDRHAGHARASGQVLRGQRPQVGG